MALAPEHHAALVAELRDDPGGVGYRGRSEVQAYALLHEERVATEPLSVMDRLRGKQPNSVHYFARIGSAFIGLAHIPNRIEPEDFTLAYVEAFS